MSALDKNVDPALWPLIEAFPPVDLTADTLASFRAAMKDLTVIPDPSSHADVRIEELNVPGGGASASTLRCLFFTPTQRAPASALLHIHGGGYVMGSPEMDIARNIDVVRSTGCAILSVDYRLAPEHAHPAALEDCHAALMWLSTRAKTLRISPDRIGVIGESAGGGLAAAVALLARDRHSVPVACQVLIYPMLMPPAQSLDHTAPNERTGRYIWTRASNNYCWSAFLQGDAPNVSTIAGLAPDVSRLPPAFIAVGELDLFVQDDLAYASRLLAAGCSVEAHLYPGAVHGFDRMVEAAVSRRYTRDMVGFIERHLG